jgi:hypothetical protein
MTWAGLAAVVVCTVAVLLFVLLKRRAVNVDELGAVSHQWLAEDSQ